MSLLLLPLHSQRRLSCPRKRWIPAQRWEPVLGHPSKGHGDPSCLLPWFREGNSLFLSHPVHQHPRGQGGRGNFIIGVIPRHSLVAVTPCHPTGAVDRGHQGGQPPSSAPERRLVRRHPLAAASKQSHMPLSSSVKGICCLLLAYKSI